MCLFVCVLVNNSDNKVLNDYDYDISWAYDWDYNVFFNTIRYFNYSKSLLVWAEDPSITRWEQRGI